MCGHSGAMWDGTVVKQSGAAMDGETGGVGGTTRSVMGYHAVPPASFFASR